MLFRVGSLLVGTESFPLTRNCFSRGRIADVPSGVRSFHVMADVKGSKKRRKSTVEEDDISSPAEQQPSPSKRLRSEKKEQKADTKTPSPTKERKPKSSKDQTSNPKKEPKDKGPSKGKDSKDKQVRTPSPIGQPQTSPLTTPKTPRGASKLGIPVDAAKTMMKYRSRLNPLVGMIYAVTQYFTESKEDMPRCEDFLPKLVDCVNSLVSTLSDPLSTLMARTPYYWTKSHFRH
jgi:hypothetical protein